MFDALARDFVPGAHRDLLLLRLLRPFTDNAGAVVRWSRYVDLERVDASVDWFEATRGVVGVDDLASCRGELDEDTSAALRDAIGGRELTGLRWTGYGEAPEDAPTVRVRGVEYAQAPLTAGDVVAGRRVPEFAWDGTGQLAWGGRLYPDSLVVAAAPSIFRQLHLDARVDVVSVRSDRDILPPSTGD